MSDAAVDVSIRLGLQDSATPGIAQAAARAQKAVDKTAASVEQANTRQRSSYEKTSQAREVLGVRSEQRIQREIEETKAAYAALTSSSVMGAREQARALEATTRRVTQLTNEMGRLTAAQEKAARAAQEHARGMKALQTGGAVVAGVAGAAYALSGPVRQSMAFDERVGLLSNTAYAERGPTGRTTGDADIKAAIMEAVKTGITKDDAMTALEKLVADNQVGGVQGALALLPYIGKVSTGSGSGAGQTAAMMGSFIGSGYAKDTEGAKRLMGLSSAGAIAGAFEKADMAKHLPALLPAAKAAGLTGEDGFKRLIVLLQQARTTAGSSDEAATNVANLLAKVQSADTAKDFEKAGRGDLGRHLMQQRARGVDPLTAWQNVIEDEIAKNPNLKPAMDQLRTAKNADEQTAAIEAIKGMAEGQSIGKYFQDMQARGAIFGLRNQDMANKVNASFGMAGTVVDGDYAHMRNRAGVETRVAGELSDLGKSAAVDAFAPAIGKLADGFASVAAKFPLLTGGATLAATALGTAAAAAGVFSVAAGGGGGVGGAITRAAGRAASWVSGPTALAGAARFTGAVGAVGATGYAAGSLLGLLIDKGIQTGTGDKSQTLGGWLYDKLNPANPLLEPTKVSNAFKGQTPAPKLDANLMVGLAPELVLYSQKMKSSGMNATISAGTASGTGNIFQGAPL